MRAASGGTGRAAGGLARLAIQKRCSGSIRPARRRRSRSANCRSSTATARAEGTMRRSLPVHCPGLRRAFVILSVRCLTIVLGPVASAASARSPLIRESVWRCDLLLIPDTSVTSMAGGQEAAGIRTTQSRATLACAVVRKPLARRSRILREKHPLPGIQGDPDASQRRSVD